MNKFKHTKLNKKQAEKKKDENGKSRKKRGVLIQAIICMQILHTVKWQKGSHYQYI